MDSLGNRFRKQEGEAYAKIVRDYPLSAYADDAARKLKELELPVPEPDKAAVARMQYEKDHRVKPGIIARDTLWLRRNPDMSTAARSGDPAMTNLRPSVPPLGSATRRRRRWRIQRRCDRNAGGRFNGARYQARCSRESARAGCGSRRHPSRRHSGRAASPRAAAATPRGRLLQPTRTQATPIRTPRRKRSKKQQQQRRPRLPISPLLPRLLRPSLRHRRPLHRIEPRQLAMSRILLADDSPHAQRMGERILREEGFEVVSLTDGNAAMLRLADVDPDLILADVFLPGKSGFELCRYVKSEPRFKHVRVVLTAGLLEPFDEDEARRAGCDAILKKPFEASKVVSTIDPLVKEAQLARGLFAEQIASVACRAVAEPANHEAAQTRRTAPFRPLRKSIPNAFAPPSPSRSTPRCPP